MMLPALHAHRGASHAEPENTMAAFERAISEGADAIELDVRLSADGVAVVFHDGKLHRVTGAEGKVSSTSWAQLATLSVAGRERIPALVELVPFARRHQHPLNIELKPLARPADLVEACLPVLRELSELCAVLVSSFDPRALALVHQRLPGLRLALIFEDLTALTALGFLPEVDLHPRHDLIDASSLPRLLDRPRALRAWTVDEPQEARRLMRLEHPAASGTPAIDALITNRPGWLRTELSRATGAT